MNAFKKRRSISFSEPQPMDCEIVTQPDCSLSLRQVLEQFSSGDVSVIHHVPVDDHVDQRTDEEFDNSNDVLAVANFEDDFDAQEFVLSQSDTLNSTEPESSEVDKSTKIDKSTTPVKSSDVNNNKPADQQEKVEEGK